MSKEAFIKFCEEVVRQDETLVAQLSASRSAGEFTAVVVSRGTAAGFVFDAQEAIAVMRAAKARRAQHELTEEQLEAVSGGLSVDKFAMQDLHCPEAMDFYYVDSSLLVGFVPIPQPPRE